ncbi:MAG TPA: NAD-dependent epimerase/dehydratase family protein [Kofleriaceae bacterium]|nr:NAD-dependent epimerase/dehydratase family protein [Kofleriaceae bacterium]
MRVLVTGATTPLGAALVRRLDDDPAVEHVLETAVEPGLADGPRRSYRRADLSRPRAVHDLVHGPARELEIDSVVHLALHRRSADEGASVHRRNVESTRALLHACAELPAIRRFVFVSSASVYALTTRAPTLLDEESALELDPRAPQWLRDRVEADLTVCARMGLERFGVVVLRCAEILDEDTGSQLWDYLRSRVCLRPLGFDPMINVLSLDDAADAIALALGRDGNAVYNVTGADTLPLSRLIGLWGRREVAVPGPLLAPLYRLRRRATGLDFRYDLNRRRFHLGGIVDDTRARRDLGYQPHHHLAWPTAPGARPGARPGA